MYVFKLVLYLKIASQISQKKQRFLFFEVYLNIYIIYFKFIEQSYP